MSQPEVGEEQEGFEVAAPGAGPTPYDATRPGSVIRPFPAGRRVGATDRQVSEIGAAS